MDTDKKLDYNDDLIQSTMQIKFDVQKTVRVVLKNIIRYPLRWKKISDFQPNIFYGYSDHPLDVRGVAPNSGFAFLRNFKGRKTCSILRIDFSRREGNSFVFVARGYDVFKVRDLNFMFRHLYRVDEKTRYAPCTLRIDFLRADAYRIRLAQGAEVPENDTPMVCGDITDQSLSVSLDEKEEFWSMTTSKLRLAIFKNEFCIEIRDKNGNKITESSGKTKNEFPQPFDCFPLGFIADKKSGLNFGVESFVLYPGEAVFGLGEHYGPVNKVGKTIGMWNYEGLGNTSGRVYKNVPFFMSTRGYGVFVNESRPITFWVGSRETCRNMFAAEGSLVDYFFFYGPSFIDILKTYTALTGRPAMPPKWSFGTWISRISYFSQEQVLSVAKKLRDMKFPSDVIHLDTGWFDKDWRCDWTFNKDRFPEPEKMFNKAKELGFRICLWQIPYALKETAIYQDAKKKNALAKNNGPFVWLGNFEASAIDFSRQEGIDWYKERIKALLKMGASTIKTDFGEQVAPHSEFKRYGGRAMHNLYPLLYQKAAFEAVKEVRGEEDTVLWSRSAYAGAQRYPIHWSGDNTSNHENLLSCLRGGLSLGFSGFTFWSQDAGGFVGIPDEDVYIRWTQISIFQSHMRYHGNPPHYKEPWNFSRETQEIVRDYLNLRYRLIPYIYSEAHNAVRKGLPFLRHLAIEYQDDPMTYYIEDQFFCGKHILVAPVMEKTTSRKVYLPEGTWYDFLTGERHEGRCWITRESDIRTIPVYIRAGTILPLAAPAQSTAELTLDRLTLHIYPNGSDFASYEIRDREKINMLKAILADDVLQIATDLESMRIKIELPRKFTFKELQINGLTVSPDMENEYRIPAGFSP